MNTKGKKRNFVAVLVTAFTLFIQCAVDEPQPLELMSDRGNIAERVSIAEIVSGIEESSHTYHREVMELQKLFDISPEAQEAFLKALVVEADLHYSYTSEGEFIWSTESWAGGTNVLGRLSNIQGSHNVRKQHYLEKLVAGDDRFEIVYSEHPLYVFGPPSLVMRGFWSVSIQDDNALLQKLSPLAQIEKEEEEAKGRGIINHTLFWPYYDYEPVRWPIVGGKNTLFFKFGTVKNDYQSIVDQVIAEINNSQSNIRLVNVAERAGGSTWSGYARDCRDFRIYYVLPLTISVYDIINTHTHGDEPSTGASHHVSPVASVNAAYLNALNYYPADKTTYIRQMLYYYIGRSIGLENEFSRPDTDQNIRYRTTAYPNYIWPPHSLQPATNGLYYINNNNQIMQAPPSGSSFKMNGTMNFDHNSIMVMTSDYRTIASGNLINKLTGATMWGSNGLSAGDRAMLNLLYQQIGTRNFSDPQYDGW